MRKLLIVALVAGAALAGAAGCAPSTPSAAPSDSASTPSSTTTTSAPADQTAQVCTAALALEKQDSTQVLSEVQQYLAAVASGNSGNSAQVLADLLKIQQDWVTAYNGYLQQPIKPEVKTALTNFVTFVQSIGTNTNQTVPQLTATYNQLDQALQTACA
jgi:hypothetical protein